ncbi:UNKNOWN [Stylonychia lemnae]|uniref:Uncharacterized protein n=1 Tax=Stylonychia lemnae TaxID=5949 RepID=A0A078B7Y2_STYLE|nr:UNKNOWN [Stylonychia lemnae]|eukprot:CDW89668.1 UNKNOWN [Stylonychia lemnae]
MLESQAGAKVQGGVDLLDGEKSVEIRRNVQIIVEEEGDKINESKRINDATNAQLVQKPEDNIKSILQNDRRETVQELIVKQIDKELIPEQQSQNMMRQIKDLPKSLENKGLLNIEQISPQAIKQAPNSATSLKQMLNVNDLPSFNARQLNNSRRSQGLLEIKKNVDKEWDDISNGSKKLNSNSNSDNEQ